MKKITILSALVFCTSLMVNAQTEKGRYTVGGSIGFNSTKNKLKLGSITTDGNKNTNIFLMPSFGVFIADGILVGTGLGISSGKSKNDDGSLTFTDSGLSLAPFGRYYHDSGLFGHLNFEIGSGKSKFESGGTSTESKTSISGWRLGGGYALFLNNNVAVEPMITYGSTSRKLKDSDPERKDITNGLMINVGFNIFIN